MAEAAENSVYTGIITPVYGMAEICILRQFLLRSMSYPSA